jgi:hypothetical protein
MNPPAQVKVMLKQEIAAIDAKLDPKTVDPAGNNHK